MTVFGVNGADRIALNALQASTNPVEQLYFALAQFTDGEGTRGIGIDINGQDFLQDQEDFNALNNAAAISALGTALEDAGVADPRRVTIALTRLGQALYATQSSYNLEILRGLLATNQIALEDLITLSQSETLETMSLDNLISSFLATSGLQTAYDESVAQTPNQPPVQPPPPPAAGVTVARDVQEFLASRGIEFTFNDSNNDSQIDWTDVFAAIDRDGNSSLELGEINDFIRAHGNGESAMLSQALYALIDNGMLAGRTGGNGSLTAEEFSHAIGVMREFAGIIGATFNEVIEAYNGEETFTNEDFDDLRAVRAGVNTDIAAYCRTNNINPSSITTEQARAILAGLNYSEAHINAVMAYIAETENLTARFLEDCVMRLVEAGRRNRDSFGVSVAGLPAFPTELDATAVQMSTSNRRAEAIQGWLRGQEFNLERFDAAIEDDGEFQHIFDWDVRRGEASQQRQLLNSYIDGLLNSEQYGMAERVLQLVSNENGEYFIARAATDSQIQSLFAEAYTSSHNYALAIRHAQAIHGSASERSRIFSVIIGDMVVQAGRHNDVQLLTQAYVLFRELTDPEQRERALRSMFSLSLQNGQNCQANDQSRCVEASSRSEYLNLALRIASENSDLPDRLTSLVTIADLFRNSRGSTEERMRALEALETIRSIDGNFMVQRREGNQTEIPIAAYILTTEDDVRRPLNVVLLEETVFTGGDEQHLQAENMISVVTLTNYLTYNLNLEFTPEQTSLIIRELNQHRAELRNTTRDERNTLVERYIRELGIEPRRVALRSPREVLERAGQYYLFLGRVWRAGGNANEIPFRSTPTAMRESDAFRSYTEMARCENIAARIFMQLRDEARLEENPAADPDDLEINDPDNAPAGRSNFRYYNARHVDATSVIGLVVHQQQDAWIRMNGSNGGYLEYPSTVRMPADRLFTELVEQIPAHSFVTNFNNRGGDFDRRIVPSSRFKTIMGNETTDIEGQTSEADAQAVIDALTAADNLARYRASSPGSDRSRAERPLARPRDGRLAAAEVEDESEAEERLDASPLPGPHHDAHDDETLSDDPLGGSENEDPSPVRRRPGNPPPVDTLPTATPLQQARSAARAAQEAERNARAAVESHRTAANLRVLAQARLTYSYRLRDLAAIEPDQNTVAAYNRRRADLIRYANDSNRQAAALERAATEAITAEQAEATAPGNGAAVAPPPPPPAQPGRPRANQPGAVRPSAGQIDAGQQAIDCQITPGAPGCPEI